MGDRSISKVSASWLNNSLCWIIVFVVSLLSLPSRWKSWNRWDNDDLDGEVLQESPKMAAASKFLSSLPYGGATGNCPIESQ